MKDRRGYEEELGGVQGADTIIRTYHVRKESFFFNIRKILKNIASSAALFIYYAYTYDH